MITEHAFQQVKQQFEQWLLEFLEKEEFKHFSPYQKENIDKMVEYLLVAGQTISRHPRTWTADNVVHLVINHMCKTIPVEAPFYEQLPDTLAPFFQFAGEQRYLRHGKKIADALLKNKASIHQSPEQRASIQDELALIQQAIQDGVNIYNPFELEAYFIKQQEKQEALYVLSEKFESLGISFEEDLDEKKMQKILQSDVFSKDLEEEKIEELLAFLAARGDVEDIGQEDLADIPPPLLLTFFGLMQSGELFIKLKAYKNRGRRPVRRRFRPKIGRNAPCSCDSGKKYKYCCAKKVITE